MNTSKDIKNKEWYPKIHSPNLQKAGKLKCYHTSDIIFEMLSVSYPITATPLREPP